MEGTTVYPPTAVPPNYAAPAGRTLPRSKSYRVQQAREKLVALVGRVKQFVRTPSSRTLPRSKSFRMQQARQKLATLVARVKSFFLFMFKAAKSPNTVGAVCPSSKYLAKEMIASYRTSSRSSEPKHYLELGAGTGPITKMIIENVLRPQDELDVVEFDPKWCKDLTSLAGTNRNIQVLEVSILDFNPGRQYDAIWSGLPLNIFSATDAARIYQKIEGLLKDRAKYTYFEYPVIPSLARPFRSKQANKQVDQVRAIKDEFLAKHAHEKRCVAANMPPAMVVDVTYVRA